MSNIEKSQSAIAFANISIKSDGTASGTEILLNGKPIKGLSYISFGFYNNCVDPIYMHMEVEDTDDVTPGQLRERKYYSLICPSPEQGKASLVRASKKTPVVSPQRAKEVFGSITCQ